jgi:phage-related protein
VFNTLELAKLLNDFDGLIGNRIKIFLIYAVKDNQGIWFIEETKEDYPLSFFFNISQCSISRDVISFTLGKPNYLKQQFPARLYHRDFCDLTYRGKYCWMRHYEYDENDPTQVALDKCDNTFQDCERHYDYFNLDEDETRIGIAYGGFPNVGKGSYIYR